MDGGTVLSECPVSTADGVRAADVAWLRSGREGELEATLFAVAPDICVEIVSPRNSRPALTEKKALYFEAGAREVWFCRDNGEMEFHLSADSPAEAQSRLCPRFPKKV